MTTRVAINGFGRIGRGFVRAALLRHAAIDIVAINDVNDTPTLAYLLEFDSVHGALGVPVGTEGENLIVDGRSIPVFHDRDPTRLPWADLGVDTVVESTGHFTMADDAAAHLTAGAGRVVISAPATGADFTVCLGVNDDLLDPATHRIVSNASCTTNCLAVMASVLHDRFGIVSGFMTTVHAYTNDQNLLDLPHRGFTRDFRRTRAAAQNIVPSTTGAARSIGDVIPALRGRLDGIAIRVPVPDGSIVDLVCRLDSEASVVEVNEAFAAAAATDRLNGILRTEGRPLVSSDIIGDTSSCVFSACDTMVRGTDVKIFGWYDNEWGYSNRLVQLAELLGSADLTPTEALAPAS